MQQSCCCAAELLRHSAPLLWAPAPSHRAATRRLTGCLARRSRGITVAAACQAQAEAPQGLKVVFVATECGPWCKVGGLADVLAALPAALAARGHEVLTVVPRYAPYAGVKPTGISVPLDLLPLVPACTRAIAHKHMRSSIVGKSDAEMAETADDCGSQSKEAAAADTVEVAHDGDDCTEPRGEELEDEGNDPTASSGQGSAALPQHADLWQCHQRGVQRVFVDHPLFSSSDIYGSTAGGSKGVYTYTEAGEQSDLDLRYSVLCQAALAAPVLLDQQTAAGQAAGGTGVDLELVAQARQRPIVFVANDWPTSMLLLRLQYSIRLGAAGRRSGKGTVSTAASCCPAASLQQLLEQRLGTDAATAYCIHNLAYQGLLAADAFPRLSLPHAALPALCTSHDWQQVLRDLEGGNGSRHVHPARAEAFAPASATAAEAADSLRCRCSTHAALAQDGSCTSAATEPAVQAAVAAATTCTSRQLNQMRAALLTADCLVTVSEGYAAEVQQEGPSACGLQDIMAMRGISGIMNGLDIVEWDPAIDPHLPPLGRYTAATVTQGKARMKACLQERLGLEVNPNAPLVGFVGRLTQQKGVDVLLAAAPTLLSGPGATPPPTPSRWRPPILVDEDVKEAAAPPPGNTLWPSSSAAHAAASEAMASDSGADGRHSRSGTEHNVRGSSMPPAALDASGNRTVMPAGAPPFRHTAHDTAGTCHNMLRSSQLAVSVKQHSHLNTMSQQPGIQLVLLGTGEPWMESALLGLAQSFPHQAAGLTTFSEELAHWIMAAADFVLVPSRFEPCGLVAQSAARYGAVPIVCGVGGLKDLVTPEVGYTLPGFSHDGSAADHQQNVHQLLGTVQAAADDYGSARYRALQQHCMALDVSWQRPAEQWERLLLQVAQKRAATAQ